MMFDLSRGNPGDYCKMEKSRAFTLIEFAVVVAILGILGGTLLNRIVFYQEQAELAAVQRMIATLRTALNLKLAHLDISNRRDELPLLAEENPMTWLIAPPSNYSGEFSGVKAEEIPKGSWCFDIFNKKLVYSLNGGEKLHDSQSNLLKFKVKLLSRTNLSDGKADGAILDQVND